MRGLFTHILVVTFLAAVNLAGCGEEKSEPPPTPRRPITAPPPTTAHPPAPPTAPAPTTAAARPTNVRPTTAPATAPAAETEAPAPPTATLPPQDATVAVFAGLTAPKPVTWLWQPPANKMIVAEYVVPGRDGSDQARIAVTPAGGTLEQNIERWKKQFRNPDGSEVEPRKIEKLQADGMPITLVEFAGEYRGMSGAYTPDQLFLTAVVEAPSGQLFIRLVGPTATVQANRESFMDMIQGIKQVEPEK